MPVEQRTQSTALGQQHHLRNTTASVSIGSVLGAELQGKELQGKQRNFGPLGVCGKTCFHENRESTVFTALLPPAEQRCLNGQTDWNGWRNSAVSLS